MVSCPDFAFGQSTTEEINWGSLDPGSDWSATVLDGLFPSSGTTGTVIGSLLGYLSALITSLATLYLFYASIMQVHRTAESGKLRSAHFSAWAPVRIPWALMLLLPVDNGYSLGQDLVLRWARLSLGIAVHGNAIVDNKIGPEALPLATPIMPGTQSIVLAVMESELCRALINQASNTATQGTTQLVPEPKFVSNGVQVSVNWALAEGDGAGSNVCGSLSLEIPITYAQASTTLRNPVGAIDWSHYAAARQDSLQKLVQNVRAPMEQIAANLWATRQMSALRAMDAVLTSNTATYRDSITREASAEIAQMRKAYDKSDKSGKGSGMTAMSGLGWIGLGAYYLQIAKLNGDVLSLAALSPDVEKPSWEGMGGALHQDLGGMIEAIHRYEAIENSRAWLADDKAAPDTVPSLYPDTAIQSNTPADPYSLLTKVIKAVGINRRLLAGAMNYAAPSSGSGANDPTAGLIGLGHLLMHTGLGVIAASAIAANPTADIAAAAGEALTGNFAGAAGTLAMTPFAGVVKSLLGPIFAAAAGLIVPGIGLAFILPMMPYFYWIAGVAGWYLIVIEAVIGVPFWALAHLTFAGDGIHGRGIRGYEILFSILFRPLLMIAGFMVSYPLFQIVSWLLLKTFTIAAAFVFDAGYLVTNLIGVIVLTSLFVSAEIAWAGVCFRMINIIPHHVVALANMTSIGRLNSDEITGKTSIEGQRDIAKKSGELARDMAHGLGGEKGEKQIDSHKPQELDSTTKALLNGSGPIGE
ncbi:MULTISPECIES: DotA/TraY family protein [Asaia]|uniref:DotA/TraY family protein n=1 Tax=Asaia spathodeae TaxID=657016 RepID=A0ABX2P866_9PROT|nr:DotA/TraY family protein [Asaia spathodeae]